jgi:hypothetical protein
MDASPTLFDVGCACIYTRSGTVWSHQQTLFSSSPTVAASDNFGSVVAIEDNLVAIGVSSSTLSEDKIHLFERSGSTWTLQTYLTPVSNNVSGTGLGSGICIYGGMIVASAPLDSSGAINVNGDPNNSTKPSSGAGYAWRKISGVWTIVLYLKAPTSTINENFGFSSPSGCSGISACSGGIIVGSLANFGAGKVYVF